MPPRWQALSLNRNEILNTYDGRDLLTGYSISITNRLEDEVLFSGDDGRCLLGDGCKKGLKNVPKASPMGAKRLEKGPQSLPKERPEAPMGVKGLKK